MLALLVAGGLGWRSARGGHTRVSLETMRVETVRQGSLRREAQARGVLVPAEIHWITAEGPARVSKIATSAGSLVEPGAVMVELDNSELELAALDAERATAGAHAELTALEVRAELDLLDDQVALVGLDTEADTLGARATTALALAREGLGPSTEGVELTRRARGAKDRATVAHKRRGTLQHGARRELDARAGAAAKLEEVARFRRKQLAALSVRAPVAGLVQEMPLEPGQWVQPGTVLAKIAKPGRLKAVLQVPEAVAGEVAPGQQVSLELTTGVVPGTVTRVDPSVSGGVVRVEVSLTSEPPEGARPDQALTATILVEDVADTLVLARPAGVAALGTTELWVLDARGRTAAKRRVRLGRGSTREIEVLDGIAAGEVVMFGDLGRLEDERVVELAN